jgi:glutaredoxin 2
MVDLDNNTIPMEIMCEYKANSDGKLKYPRVVRKKLGRFQTENANYSFRLEKTKKFSDKNRKKSITV